MRTTTRLLVVGLLSLVVIGSAPAQSASARPLRVGAVYCCR
ncbi:MAG: hypothetical protein WB441_04750 [Nocardioidaceae bacterium]